MTEASRPRRQKAMCAICGRPIGEGEGVRRVTLPGHTAVLPTHSTCYDRDWEAVESGLEPFELRFARRSANAS